MTEESALEQLVVRSAKIGATNDGRGVIEARRVVIEELKALGGSARVLLAQNQLQLALELSRSGEPDSSLEELAEVANGCADLVLPDGRPVLAEVLSRRALYSFRDGRYEETVAAADALVEAYGADGDLADVVAGGLANKARALAPGRLGRLNEQFETLREIVARFGSSSSPAVGEWVVFAMFQLGGMLDDMGNHQQASSVWEELFEKFKRAPLPRAAAGVPFSAQANRVALLVADELIDDAVAATKNLSAVMADAHETFRAAEIGKGLIRAGRALDHGGRLRNALAAFQTAGDRLLTEPAEEPRTLGVYAQIDAGIMLMRLGDQGAAMTVMESVVAVGSPALVALDDLIRRAEEPGGGLPREQAPWTMIVKGLVLEQSDRLSEARETYGRVVNRFGSEESPTVQRLVAAAQQALERTSS